MFTFIAFFIITLPSATAQHAHSHHHFEHDPRTSLRTIKCHECYETELTKSSACSRTKYCEGKWCVKGPDSRGTYRGCMHLLPFKIQTARCYNITEEDGRVHQNCYCNSYDFCNNSPRLSPMKVSTLLLAILFNSIGLVTII